MRILNRKNLSSLAIPVVCKVLDVTEASRHYPARVVIGYELVK